MTESPIPVSVRTAQRVEYAATGEGPTVLALHGAMGGWDQALILARTVDPTRFRTLALSRPGYLGTALAAGGRRRNRPISTRPCSTRLVWSARL